MLTKVTLGKNLVYETEDQTLHRCVLVSKMFPMELLINNSDSVMKNEELSQ